MTYRVYISPDSEKIENLIVIYPGMDSLASLGSTQPLMSNNINKYELFAEITSKFMIPDSAIIVLEYSAPYEWGTPINFSVLTNGIAYTLRAALDKIRTDGFQLYIKRIDLGAHSYGMVPLFWSLANNIYEKIPGVNAKCEKKLHLFEPYGFAAIRDEENTRAYRDQEVVAAARERFHGIVSAEKLSEAAKEEITLLRSFDVKNVNIMFGMLNPIAEVHNSYGAIDPKEAHIKIMKLDGVGHGAGLLDILKSQLDKKYAPDYALKSFQILLSAWIFSLHGIKKTDTQEEIMHLGQNIQKKIESLCIEAGIMASTDLPSTQKLKSKL